MPTSIMFTQPYAEGVADHVKDLDNDDVDEEVGLDIVSAIEFFGVTEKKQKQKATVAPNASLPELPKDNNILWL